MEFSCRGQLDWSGKPVLTNGMRPQSLNSFTNLGELSVAFNLYRTLFKRFSLVLSEKNYVQIFVNLR